MTSIRWIDVGELMATEPPPIPWIVEPLLARGHITMLAGAPGVGKSLLAIAIASTVAHRADQFAGMPVTGGRVLILDAENGQRTLHQRAHLVELHATNARIGLAVAFDLRKQDGHHDLHQVIADFKPSLLILDSLASLAPGLKENEADQAGPVLDRLRRLAQDTNTGILLLHHTRKDADTYRGGTSLPAAVEIVAIYTRAKGDDDPTRRVLDWSWERGGKMRLDAEPDPRYLSVQVDHGRLTIAPADAPDTPAPANQKGQKRLELRAKAIDIVATEGAVRQGQLLRQLGLSDSSQSGRRALADAVEDGHLTKLDDGHFTLGPALSATLTGTPDSPLSVRALRSRPDSDRADSTAGDDP